MLRSKKRWKGSESRFLRSSLQKRNSLYENNSGDQKSNAQRKIKST